MIILLPVKAAFRCAAIAAAMLVVYGCGRPGKPARITIPASGDTVWGKVVIKAELAGSRIPPGGLDFYLDTVRLGNVAHPTTNTKSFEYTWDAGALPAASVHTLGAVTRGGKAPKPPRSINVTIDSAPVLSVTQNRTSYWRVARIVLKSDWSTVLVESLGLLGGKSVWSALKEPALLTPNSTVLLHEEEFCSTHPLPVVITYRSLIGKHSRDEVEAIAVKTETLTITAAEPIPALRRLLPDTR
jgi:hypothetical protein